MNPRALKAGGEWNSHNGTQWYLLQLKIRIATLFNVHSRLSVHEMVVSHVLGSVSLGTRVHRTGKWARRSSVCHTVGWWYEARKTHTVKAGIPQLLTNTLIQQVVVGHGKR